MKVVPQETGNNKTEVKDGNPAKSKINSNIYNLVAQSDAEYFVALHHPEVYSVIFSRQSTHAQQTLPRSGDSSTADSLAHASVILVPNLLPYCDSLLIPLIPYSDKRVFDA